MRRLKKDDAPHFVKTRRFKRKETKQLGRILNVRRLVGVCNYHVNLTPLNSQVNLTPTFAAERRRDFCDACEVVANTLIAAGPCEEF
jgi:hypothetical protein